MNMFSRECCLSNDFTRNGINIYIDFNAHDNSVGLLLIFNVAGHQFMKLIWIFKSINKNSSLVMVNSCLSLKTN